MPQAKGMSYGAAQWRRELEWIEAGVQKHLALTLVLFTPRKRTKGCEDPRRNHFVCFVLSLATDGVLLLDKCIDTLC